MVQETALKHVSSFGASQNNFGATQEMELRKLIWVVNRIFRFKYRDIANGKHLSIH